MFSEIILWDLNKPLKLRHNPHTGPYIWKPAIPGTGRGFYQAPRRELVMGDSSFRLRLIYANELLGSARLADISGYYMDEDCSGDTLQPIVARLNHERGFLAGWTMGQGMCASLGSHIWDNAEDAALNAHQCAERDAQKEIDYQASLCRECFENPCVCEKENEDNDN